MCDNDPMAKVTVVPCGPAVNESERKAIAQLKTRLISAQADGEWLLLTNLPFSATDRRQSDEIDILAIGPPGVRVVEVKHWGGAWVGRNAAVVAHEAERVTDKARRVGTTLRLQCPDVGRVDGVFLLTESAAKVKGIAGPVRGIPFHTLKTWRDALGFDLPSTLSAHQVRALGNALTPASRLATGGNVKRLCGYVRLELQTPPEERFHRVFTATHSSRRDRVILHLYDWSASDDAKAEEKARREFNALHRLQQHGWAPRIVDSFQQVPGYPGEIHFFTVVDPAAPSIAERASDGSWGAKARLAFARNAIRALEQLHGAGDDLPMLHRNLTPATVLVKHDNSPILTGFDHARIPAHVTVASAAPRKWHPATAPEVRAQGLAAADRRSDVYSMCASLITLFQQTDEATPLLARGMADNPGARTDLADLSGSLARLLGETPPAATPPPVRFWTEDQEVWFEGHRYRIVSRLGSGGVGAAFKVVEMDPKTGEDLGAYVAKAIHDGKDAERMMRAYRLVRPYLSHPALSTIYQVASEWRDNGFAALMTWIEGEPLGDYAGQFHEASDEALAIRWLRAALDALDTLHRNGLAHGDVSPRNIIVCGSDVVLTDYDCATKIGEERTTVGTVMYSSFVEGTATTPADDIYALAASFFHVVFDRLPFQHEGLLAKDRGLNWADIDQGAYPVLKPFFDKATDPRREERYAAVEDAICQIGDRTNPPVPSDTRPNPALTLTSMHQEARDRARPAPRRTDQPATHPRHGGQADAIRQHALDRHVAPWRQSGGEVLAIRAGDIVREMELRNATPNVCNALEGQKFLALANLALVRRDGPRRSTRTTFHYRDGDNHIPLLRGQWTQADEQVSSDCNKIQPLVRELMWTLLVKFPKLLDAKDKRGLQDEAHCWQLGLKISNLPLLRHTAAGTEVNGYSRYWRDPYGDFHVCSQWWKQHHHANARALLASIEDVTERSEGHPEGQALRRHEQAFRDYLAGLTVGSSSDSVVQHRGRRGPR